MKPDIIIAIDPDSDKSGIAQLTAKGELILPPAMSFPQLIDYITNTYRACIAVQLRIIVIVEAGWLNKSNWHLSPKDTKAIAAAKGNAVGRNHETGRKIIEMLRHNDIPVEEARPLAKCWKAGKASHEELAYFIPGLPNRTNQEQRDAILIAWDKFNFPVKIKPIKTQIK